MSAKKAQTDVESLDRFAGYADLAIHGEQVESLADVSEGDLVAKDAGRGLQGVVTEVRTEGSPVHDKRPGKRGVQKIRVRTHTGGERVHLVVMTPEEAHDGVIRFKLPGGSDDYTHKLVRINK